MPTVIDLASQPEAALAGAVSALRDGGTVLLPTDTVYGVAALPSVEGATGQLFRLKDRSDAQPLAVLVANADQARTLVAPEALTDNVNRWMVSLWPGALTIVLPRSIEAAALELGGSPDTIGLRCPDHDFVRALAGRVGPLATTSANRHGSPTLPTARTAAADLSASVDLIVDGGLAGTVASTVVDATVHPARILREGSIGPGELRL